VTVQSQPPGLTATPTTWSPVLTGFSGSPTLTTAVYVQIGKFVQGTLVANGTGDGSGLHTATLPVACAASNLTGMVVHIGDSGLSGDSVGNMDVLGTMSTTLLYITATVGGGSWSPAGTHYFGGTFFYFTA
jgi:hypothetical protein